MKKITLIFSLLIIVMTSKAQFNAVKHKTLSGYADDVYEVEFSPKGNYFALTVGDNTVELYDKNFNKLWDYKGNSNYYAGSVSFSPDEKFMAFSSYKSITDVAILRLSDMKIIKTISDHTNYVRSVCFSLDGKYFASGSADNKVMIYKLSGNNFERMQTISDHTSYVRSVCFSPDGKYLASGSWDNKVMIYKLNGNNFKRTQTIEHHTNYVMSVCFSPDGKYLASGSADDKVMIYKLSGNNFKRTQTIEDHTNLVFSVCFSPDGKYFASGAYKEFIIYQLSGNNFEKTQTISDHTNFVSSVCFSPDGKYLASGSYDKTAIIYKLSGVGSGLDNIQDNSETVTITKKKKYKPANLDKTPPEITIIFPDVSRGLKPVVKSKRITIKGKVKDASGIFEVLVNNEEAFVDEHGDFRKNVLLGIGETEFTVSATDIKSNTSTKTFTIKRISQSIENEIVNIPVNPDILQTGKYYALIIGVKDYRDPSINDLNEPINDALELYNVLRERYSFESENIIFLKNPSKNEITESLDNYAEIITEKDNLIVFYAGHGYWDKKFKQGYWFLSDSYKSKRSTWLSNGIIRDYMQGISSKHTLLITDACFGGSIFKIRKVFINPDVATKELYKYPSRKAMTSGNLKEVPDKSVFIKYLVKRLRENNKKYLASEQLFASFKEAVINNSPNNQIPQFGEVKETGDEGGDFIFKLK